MTTKEEYLNDIDNYGESIIAMVGFMNFYRYDSANKKMRNDILIFQGRRLDIENGEKANSVTPDIGILMPSQRGVLGEVKKSFPQNSDYWIDDFNQLMSYDNELIGWPSENERVSGHDIVLILHQSRAVAIRQYYEEKMQDKIKFKRPFVIISFNRSDERKAYYYFEKRCGSLSNSDINLQLETGVQVPMEVFVGIYSTIKIYDSEPPPPYLMDLIWTNVILQRASGNEKFSRLRKNQKIEVTITIEEIIDELYEQYSFYPLQRNHKNRQSKIPRGEWVTGACEKFIEIGLGKWTNSDHSSITLYFKKIDDVLSYFIDMCISHDLEAKQIEMFKKTNQCKSLT